MLLLFYKSFPVIAQYLIYTSLNLTVPLEDILKQHLSKELHLRPLNPFGMKLLKDFLLSEI
ncbi:hypothetical protein [Rickettsia sp. MEAM1 (Bemisia tabaci)]|uniref:hypothetical protein n=1 Tax=Rickettsia sp. MEAM1 (Bemisia tabaci) TaxID=1182263 RepID=UPI0012FDE82A|nr:hypothetical protein [Rickettsia sp. MEAM1 (Bemisia tabaci)]